MNAAQENEGAPSSGAMATPPVYRRVAAFVVDQVLLAIVAGVAVAPLAMEHIGKGYEEALRAQLQAYAAFLLPQPLAFVYYAVMHGAWGKSIGKALCGIVVRTTAGARLSPATALIRAFWSSGICALPLAGLWIAPGVFKLALLAVILYALANAIPVLTTPAQRALHDLFAGTVVVSDGGVEHAGSGKQGQA